jgi:ABC-type multidrug transport system fused ATPase/permease subunit
VERDLLEVFARADALAMRYQKQAHTFMRAMFWLGGLLVLAFSTYAHLLTSWYVLILYPVVYLVAMTVFWWQERGEFYERFLDYRALAEGIRVQLFWRLAGVSDDVSMSYLRKQSDELQWIREAIRALNVVPPLGPTRFDLVEDYWIRGQHGQLTYFRKSAKRDKQRLETTRRSARVLYAAGLVLSVIVAVVTAMTTLPQTLLSSLIVLMAMIPAGVSLWLGWSEQMTLKEQTKQYARMARLFHHADELARDIKRSGASDPEKQRELQRLILDLGLEALIENGDWLLMHRERPVEVPNAGA